MDKLKTAAPHFYSGTVAYIKRIQTTHKTLDEGGRAVLQTLCKRMAIEDALKYSHNRRTYSSAYFTRDKKKSLAHLDDFENLGPRWVKFADEVSTRIGHKGWYTDDICADVLRGVVLCFSRKGRDVYMAGTQHSDCEGVTLDLDVTDDEMTAARWADRMAEREAEECREETEELELTEES